MMSIARVGYLRIVGHGNANFGGIASPLFIPEVFRECHRLIVGYNKKSVISGRRLWFPETSFKRRNPIAEFVVKGFDDHFVGVQI